jgi:SseB protein C-terminal domain
VFFKRLFGGGDSPFREFKAKSSTLQFLGEPTGEGLGLLKAELSDILRAEGNARRAYLTRLKYPREDQIRVALVIDGAAPKEQMAPPIARDCQPLVSIDLIFFESLPPEMVEHFEQTMTPFYVAAPA